MRWRWFRFKAMTKIGNNKTLTTILEHKKIKERFQDFSAKVAAIFYKIVGG